MRIKKQSGLTLRKWQAARGCGSGAQKRGKEFEWVTDKGHSAVWVEHREVGKDARGD